MNYDESTSTDRGYLNDLARNIDGPGVLAKLILWIKLSSGRVPGFRFVHDFPIAGYVIDFYCPSTKLGIDVAVAGEEHVSITAETRRSTLEAHGVMLLSFTEEEVTNYTSDVIEHIQILSTAFGRIPRTG